MRWVIPRKLVPLNKYLNMHWRQRQSEGTSWRMAVIAVCGIGPWAKRKTVSEKGGVTWRLEKGHEPLRRVRLELVVRCRRKQDEDNLNGSLKPVVDALVRKGWIVDDTEEWLEYEPRPRQDKLDGGAPRVEITIEAVQ